MSEAGEQRWNRSAYPLQNSTKGSTAGSAHVTPAPSQADWKEQSSLSLRHTPADVKTDLDPRSPYQTASYPNVQEYFPNSSGSVDGGGAASYRLSRANLRAKEKQLRSALSSAASVASYGDNEYHHRRSAGPDHTMPPIHITKGNGGDLIPAISLGTETDSLDGLSYSARAFVMHNASGADSSSTLLPSHEQSHEHDQYAFSSAVSKAPTSDAQRIEQTTSRIDSNASSSTDQPVKVEGSVASETASWARHAYPLHTAPLDDVLGKFSTNSVRLPSANSTSLAVPSLPSPPPTPPEERLQKVSETAPSEASESEQAKSSGVQWSRRGYPLQALQTTAPHVTVQSPPPTPAHATSAHNEQQPAPQAANRGPAPRLSSATNSAPAAQTSQSPVFRRQRYPLQSPASKVELRQPQAGSSLQAVQEDDAVSQASTERPPPSEASRRPSATPSAAASAAPSKGSAPRRQQRYPLNTAASIPNLKDAKDLHLSLKEHERDDDAVSTTASTAPSQLGLPAGLLSPRSRLQRYPVHSSESLRPMFKDRPKEDVVPQNSFEKRREEAMEMLKHEQEPEWKVEHKAEEKKTKDRITIPKNIQAYQSEQPKIKGRTIVICLDGTGDKFDSDNSNIVHLVSGLKKDDARQVTYYQAGIGTYGSTGLSSGFEAAMDMAVGSGLGLHVRDAYQFLMHSYKEGDKICIFGFSRGAYTARCLAGMVHKVGLLPPRNIQQVPFAYEFYKDDTAEGWRQSIDFKKTFSINVNVYFLGCFDSVASVGFIPRQLPLSSTPTNKPRYFRHAMALDERRAKFKVCRHASKDWEDIEEEEQRRLTHSRTISWPLSASGSDSNGWKTDAQRGGLRRRKLGGLHHRKHNKHDDNPGRQFEDIEGSHEEEFDTDVLEVWFAGAHADIGGGAVKNVERHKLAQIPLRWMIRQAFECDTGIIFKAKVLAEHGLDVHTLWPKYSSLGLPSSQPPASMLEKYKKELPDKSVRISKFRPIDEKHGDEPLYHFHSHEDEDWTPEQVEDYYDAITPLNDQLVQAPSWWILEILPVEYKIPIKPGKYVTRYGPNMGQYRAVEDKRPNLHWTVQRRIQHMGYKMGVRTAQGTAWKAVV